MTAAADFALPDRERARLKRFRVQVFASTWASYAGFYFCRHAFYIVKGELTLQLGLDASVLANIGVVYLIAYTIGTFGSAYVGTRTGARRLLLAGMALSIGCNVVFGFANNAWTFMAFMALNGLAQGTGWSGNIATIAHWFKRQERGQVMGLWATCYQVGGALAKGFAAFMLGMWGWHWSFFGASMVLGGVWFLFYFLQRNKPEDVGLPAVVEDEQPDEAPGSTPTSGPPEQGRMSRETLVTILLMGVLYFFLKFIRYALWSWAPYFLQLNLGLEKGTAGYVSILFDVFGFFGVLTAGFVSDRTFKGRRSGVILVMMVGLVFATFGLWSLGVHSLLAFCVTYSLIAFTLYGPDSLISGAGAIDVASRQHALVAAGVINGMGSIGSVVQELLIGNLYQSDPSNLASIFVTFVIAAGIATVVMGLLALRAAAGKCRL